MLRGHFNLQTQVSSATFTLPSFYSSSPFSAELLLKFLDLSLALSLQAFHPGLMCIQIHKELSHWLLSTVHSVAWPIPSFPRLLHALFHTALSYFVDSQELTLFALAHCLAWPGEKTGWTCLGVTAAV